MKYASVSGSLSFSLVRFVRDSHPTEHELLEWLGVSQQGRYYLLLKAGVLLRQHDKLILSPQHLSPDGKYFTWGNSLYNIDKRTIITFRIEEPEQVDTHHYGAVEAVPRHMN